MRHLFLFCIAAGLACARAAAQDASPAPTADPANEWIGRGEIPWVIPRVMHMGVVFGQVVTLDTIEFDSPVVVEVLAKAGIEVVSLDAIRAIKSRHVEPAVPVAPLGAREVGSWAMELPTVRAMVPSLLMELPTVKLLTIKDQGAVMRALLSTWAQFYSMVGPPVQQAENHFGKERTALQARAESGGITPELLRDCQAYQRELEAATSTGH